MELLGRAEQLEAVSYVMYTVTYRYMYCTFNLYVFDTVILANKVSDAYVAISFMPGMSASHTHNSLLSDPGWAQTAMVKLIIRRYL